jgi:hypothetical protein
MHDNRVPEYYHGIECAQLQVLTTMKAQLSSKVGCRFSPALNRCATFALEVLYTKKYGGKNHGTISVHQTH